MNDLKLGDWLAHAQQHLDARRAQLSTQSGAYKEITWYVGAIEAAVVRINALEQEATIKLQPRDKIALQLVPDLINSKDIRDAGQAMGRAFELADLFLEARKEPAIKTIVPVNP